MLSLGNQTVFFFLYAFVQLVSPANYMNLHFFKMKNKSEMTLTNNTTVIFHLLNTL